MKSIEIIITQLIPLLKKRGYKKYRTTWVKMNGEITIVFNIQKSQYSGDIWYYNYGIGFKRFYGKPITSISRCDIIYRLGKNGNEISASTAVAVLDTWEKYYGSLDKLRVQAIEDKIPPFISGRARTFLTTVLDLDQSGDGSLIDLK